MAFWLGSTSRILPPPVTRHPPTGTGQTAVSVAVTGWLVQVDVQVTITLSQESETRFSASPDSVTWSPLFGRSNGCGLKAIVSGLFWQVESSRKSVSVTVQPVRGALVPVFVTVAVMWLAPLASGGTQVFRMVTAGWQTLHCAVVVSVTCLQADGFIGLWTHTGFCAVPRFG